MDYYLLQPFFQFVFVCGGERGGLGECPCCLNGCKLTCSARSSQKVRRQPLGVGLPRIEDKSHLQQRRLNGSNTGAAGPHHGALTLLPGHPHPPANPSPLRPSSSSAGLSLPNPAWAVLRGWFSKGLWPTGRSRESTCPSPLGLRSPRTMPCSPLLALLASKHHPLSHPLTDPWDLLRPLHHRSINTQEPGTRRVCPGAHARAAGRALGGRHGCQGAVRRTRTAALPD